MSLKVLAPLVVALMSAVVLVLANPPEWLPIDAGASSAGEVDCDDAFHAELVEASREASERLRVRTDNGKRAISDAENAELKAQLKERRRRIFEKYGEDFPVATIRGSAAR